MDTLSVEPTRESEFGPCECCGDKSRFASGYVRSENGETAYFVHWTLGKVGEHGAHFDLLIPKLERLVGVSVEYRLTESGPGFMVIDADGRPVWKRLPEADLLSREDVVGTPLAQRVFDTLDAIWLQDDRLRELHGDVA